jgi:glycosyltransferase involved in cell wall biosynthesis
MMAAGDAGSQPRAGASDLLSGIRGDGPRLSIVMPNYNHGHIVEEALAAISQQTMPPLEVVVVDDGSTDDSVMRLQSLTADKPWLTVHCHRENLGVNAACNTGLALVRGDFVLFSAADDCLSPEVVERASAAAAAFPQTGLIFSDWAEMSADGSGRRIIPLDLPQVRKFFSPDAFVHLMQDAFFHLCVSSAWFDVGVLRSLGGFSPDVKWHGDLLAAYAAAFERGAVYIPGAVSYFRISPSSYSAAGRRSGAQLDVLRAWHATTRRPGWERRRTAFVSAAVLPDYSLRALRALASDPGYVTPRLIRRLVWLATWTKLARFFGNGLRQRVRSMRTAYRRGRLSEQ